MFLKRDYKKISTRLRFLIIMDIQNRTDLLDIVLKNIRKLYFSKTQFVLINCPNNIKGSQGKHRVTIYNRSTISYDEIISQKEYDYIILLDRPCVIEGDFLIRLNREITRRKLEFFYTDNWEIDQAGNKSHMCKPEFSPDYLLAFNYIKGPLLLSKGLFQLAFEGNRLSNLNLGYRSILNLTLKNTIPSRLPLLMTSQFQEHIDYKKTRIQDRLEIVSNYLKSCESEAEVTIISAELLNLGWPLITEEDVSIIIPFKDQLDLTIRSVNSILQKTRYKHFNILLISNNSDPDETLKPLKDFIANKNNISLLEYNKPFNYSAINNYAAKNTHSKYLLFLNNDTEVITEKWLIEMISQMQRPDTGVVGSLLLYPDDTVQHAGIITGLGHVAGHAHRGLHKDSPGYMNRLRCVQEYSAVTGACLLTQRDVFESLGGFDQENLPISNNDVDYCLRVRETGKKVLWTPKAILYHYESKSRNHDLSDSELERFNSEINYMKKRHNLNNDPFFNDNFVLHSEKFEL